MAPVDDARSIRFTAGSGPEVSAVLLRPPQATALLVLGHGAGAGMHHRFMDAITHRLAALNLATFRYQFPYMEAGTRWPDPQPMLLDTVRSAVAVALGETPQLPLLAGGKSMGGRMTSLAAAQQPLEGVQGIVFVGFPLHPASRPSTERAQHLSEVTVPMLFLAGTRDKLAGLDLLRPVCDGLGDGARLHEIEGADHSFAVLKRSGRTDDEVLDELAATTRAWVAQVE
jgi:predicted alpha/beta-hydrolase family hydrolase